MTWMHIARKDFEDAGRSKLLWVLTALMLLLVAGLAAIPYFVEEAGDPLSFLFTPIGFFVPILGLMVGYRAIVGERESGSIRFLLGLPNSRQDVLIGKIIGRAAVVAVPTLIAFAIGALVIAGLYNDFDISSYVGLLLFSLVIGLVYVAIAVGVSASVSSRAKALAGVASIFIVFDIIWDFVPMALFWIVERSLQFTDLPGWYLLLERVSPANSLNVIAVTLIDFMGSDEFDVTTAGRYAGDELPFYLETWFAWLFIFLWIVVPLGIGYLRFKRSTLN